MKRIKKPWYVSLAYNFGYYRMMNHIMNQKVQEEMDRAYSEGQGQAESDWINATSENKEHTTRNETA